MSIDSGRDTQTLTQHQHTDDIDRYPDEFISANRDTHRHKYANTGKSIVLSFHFSYQQSDKSTRILISKASEITFLLILKTLKSKN